MCLPTVSENQRTLKHETEETSGLRQQKIFVFTKDHNVELLRDLVGTRFRDAWLVAEQRDQDDDRNRHTQ